MKIDLAAYYTLEIREAHVLPASRLRAAECLKHHSLCRSAFSEVACCAYRLTFFRRGGHAGSEANHLKQIQGDGCEDIQRPESTASGMVCHDGCLPESVQDPHVLIETVVA